MNIQKLIIHSLDQDMRTEVLSEKLMNLNEASYVMEYIERFTRSFLNSSGTYFGVLNEDSQYIDIVNQKFDFISYTKEIAKRYFDFHRNQDESNNINLIFSQVEHSDQLFFACYEVHAKDGFIRILNESDIKENQIIHNSMILPNSFSSVKSAFLFNLESSEIILKGQSKYEEFFSNLFDCIIQPNSKTSFTIMQELINETMESRNEPSLNKIIKVKEILHDVSSEFDIVSTRDVLEEVIEGSSDEERQKINERLEIENIKDDLDLRRLRKSRALSRHKFKTENGIEISLPLNEIDLNQAFRIIENEDGSKDIILINVGEIV